MQTTSPELTVGIIAAVGITCFLVVRGIIFWIRQAPQTPNPWDANVEESLHQPEAVPVCHKCFSPQGPFDWFCPSCGAAAGPYNNLMPYVYVFSEGEVLRNGTTEHIPVNTLTVVGYLLYSLGVYMIVAPVYWLFLFRNIRRIRREEAAETETDVLT